MKDLCKVLNTEYDEDFNMRREFYYATKGGVKDDKAEEMGANVSEDACSSDSREVS